MVRILKSSFTLILLGILLVSCQKDDDNNEMALGGNFKVDGVTYELSKGFIVDEGGEYNIILTSSSISEFPGGGDAFIGSGNVVSLMLISSSQDSFEPGTFNFNSNGTSVPGTIEYAEARLNANMETETEDLKLIANGGIVEVSLTNNTYVISFNMNAENGAFEGVFRGELTVLID